MDIHDEIQSALARPATNDADTSDLEQELEELMKADISDHDNPPNDDSGVSDDLDKEFEKLKLNLPNVPESSPDISLKEAI